MQKGTEIFSPFILSLHYSRPLSEDSKCAIMVSVTVTVTYSCT